MDASQMSWTVEEILPEDEEDRRNVPVYAADIPEPKLASPILRALGDAHPLPRLTHVKRIRKTEVPNVAPRMSIVLCPVAEAASALGSEPVVFPDTVAAVIAKYGLSPFLAEVPGRPARSLEESKEDCKIWPVTFHPNREGAGPVKEELSEEDLRSMWRFMQSALKEAKRAAECGQPVNGCVIVDPSTQRIVASGFDHSGRAPPHSAAGPQNALLKRPQPGSQALLGLATAAEKPVAEAPLSSSEPSDRTMNGGNDSDRAGPSTEKRASQRSVNWHPLKHAAIVAVDACARADHEQFPDFGRHGAQPGREIDREASFLASSLPVDSATGTLKQSLSCEASVDTCSKRAATNHSAAASNAQDLLTDVPVTGSRLVAEPVGRDASESEEKRRKVEPSSCTASDQAIPRGAVFATKPYLCTGFDAYLVREPCTMCAMALVHSRVRRVIYGLENPKTGALGGRYNLQTKKSLNHHYKVFCMRLSIPQVNSVLL